MQSTKENDFECFARTVVNTLEIMFPNSVAAILDFPKADFWDGMTSV